MVERVVLQISKRPGQRYNYIWGFWITIRSNCFIWIIIINNVVFNCSSHLYTSCNLFIRIKLEESKNLKTKRFNFYINNYNNNNNNTDDQLWTNIINSVFVAINGDGGCSSKVWPTLPSFLLTANNHLTRWTLSSREKIKTRLMLSRHYLTQPPG